MNIPPTALEAGARAIATMEGAPEAWMLRQVRARAAFLAMLEAWPGMTRECVVMADRMPCIILPLPQEASDAKR